MRRHFDEKEKQDQLVGEAEKWLGTKWSDRVFSVGMGTDCLRFILQIWSKCGVKIAGKIPNSVVGRGVGDTNDSILGTIMEANSHIMEREGYQVGDITMLGNNHGYRHYVLHLPNGRIIHCDNKNGVCYRDSFLVNKLNFRNFVAVCQET